VADVGEELGATRGDCFCFRREDPTWAFLQTGQDENGLSQVIKSIGSALLILAQLEPSRVFEGAKFALQIRPRQRKLKWAKFSNVAGMPDVSGAR
jgi:hypothetical protein